MSNVTKGDIVAGLRKLGVRPGDKLLVHSSLSSFGQVEGGAEAVIDALIEAISPGGTVLVPTLTGDETLSPANPPVFDPASTPCWTGTIPEVFRKRPDAVRSLHPTHSVAAIGPDAHRLTEDHINSVTPCDELSPYGKLARCKDAYILLIGVDHQVSTTFHHVEEAAGVDYHMQEGLAQAVIIVGAERMTRHILLHQYGTPRDFRGLEPLLIERDVQREALIGDARVRLIGVRGMVEIALRCLRASPRFLCAR
jgi:aminoglycoside 3-N-acetyltransferase